MIELMASGKVIKPFTLRKAKNGNEFITGHVLAINQTKEKEMLSLISFDEESINVLKNLEPNDAICIIGQASSKHFINQQGEIKTGFDVLVTQVISIYQITKKKKAIRNIEPKYAIEETIFPTQKDIQNSDIPLENKEPILTSDEF